MNAETVPSWFVLFLIILCMTVGLSTMILVSVFATTIAFERLRVLTLQNPFRFFNRKVFIGRDVSVRYCGVVLGHFIFGATYFLEEPPENAV